MGWVQFLGVSEFRSWGVKVLGFKWRCGVTCSLILGKGGEGRAGQGRVDWNFRTLLFGVEHRVYAIA